jgi:hypothetical protein
MFLCFKSPYSPARLAPLSKSEFGIAAGIEQLTLNQLVLTTNFLANSCMIYVSFLFIDGVTHAHRTSPSR